MSDKSLYCSHLQEVSTRPNLSNEIIPFNEEKEELYKTRAKECVKEIQSIFEAGYSPENGNRLVSYIQRQRSLLAEVMLRKFVEKPDPKMADAMNTLLGQMEKSVRDDRKEIMQGKQMETSRETFELFSKTLGAVIDGQIKMPDFGTQSLMLDPMQPLMSETEAKIKPGELIVGRHVIDVNPIEAQLQEIRDADVGEELAE